MIGPNSATGPPDAPDWLLDAVGHALARDGLTRFVESITVPSNVSTSELVDLVVQRIREIERHADHRVTLIDLVLVADDVDTLRTLIDGGVLESVHVAACRAAAREPRTVWTESVAATPSKRLLADWARGDTITAAFVRDLVETERPAPPSRVEVDRVAAAVEVDAETLIAALGTVTVPDPSPGWSRPLLAHVLESSTGGAR